MEKGIFMPQATRQVDCSGIAAILLAAGMSQRLGFAKQTHVYQGESLIKRQFKIMQTSQLKNIYLLTGAYRDECLLEMQDSTGWQEIYNSHFRLGMGSSIKTAVRHFKDQRPDLNALLFCVCDQIMLTSQHINKIIELFLHHFDSQSGPFIVASEYQDTIGIPAIFPRKFFDDLLKIQDKEGAKCVLQDHKAKCLMVPFSGGEIDIDRPADLLKS